MVLYYILVYLFKGCGSRPSAAFNPRHRLRRHLFAGHARRIRSTAVDQLDRRAGAKHHAMDGPSRDAPNRCHQCHRPSAASLCRRQNIARGTVSENAVDQSQSARDVGESGAFLRFARLSDAPGNRIEYTFDVLVGGQV